MRNFGGSHCTSTAVDFWDTVRIFANQLTFRFGAVGFVTFPIALRLFTNRFTFRFRGLAVSDAVGLFANSDTFRTVKHFTSFVRTFNFALRLFTFDIANGVLRFSTRCMTFWWFTDRVTNGGAVRIITFPRALGMALRG